jgi:mannose-6-phosphate isomerase
MSPETLRTWLLESALPLWLDRGVDWQDSAFVEELHPADLASHANFRRLRVATRQTYVFARAATLGVPRAADARDLGLAWIAQARQPDGSYVSRFDLAGTAIDPVRDLYDHAFVLLALAHGRQRDAAIELMTYLDAAFRHPQGGWRESLPDAMPRRQNPHMHLLEGALAAAERFGDTVFFDAADGLIDLFLERLFQPAEGALPEYFSSDLIPDHEPQGYRVEPGHHHEWVWLLDEHRRVASLAGRTQRDTQGPSAALLAFAECHGVDAQGEIAAELWSDGRIASEATRIWPYTERLKALVAAGDTCSLANGCAALGRYLDHPVPGLWHERRGPRTAAASPASSLYHLTCAILELERAS